jgi:hypothetical protein
MDCIKYLRISYHLSVDDLDGNLLSCRFMPGQQHLAETTLAQQSDGFILRVSRVGVKVLTLDEGNCVPALA